jgi:hypothetical protein
MIYAIAIGDKTKLPVFVSNVSVYHLPDCGDGETTRATVGITTMKKIALKFWTRKGAQAAIDGSGVLRKFREDGNDVRPFYLWSLF